MKNYLSIATMLLITISSYGYAQIDNRQGVTFVQLDANQDGVLSKDELPPRMQQYFAGIDSDGDGAVTESEFTAMQANHRGKQGRFKNRPIFAQLDMNEDGVLTKEELPPRMQQYFAGIDSDGDGAITESEFTAMQANHRGKQGRYINRPTFAQLDMNEDGVLTKEELPPLMQQYFAGIDSDGDGAITESEFVAVQAKHRGK